MGCGSSVQESAPRNAPQQPRAAEGAVKPKLAPAKGAFAPASIEVKKLTPEELEPIILKLFLDADADSSGYLDKLEFAHALKSADLGLKGRQIELIQAEADKNGDNVIEYKEFLPVMVTMLQGIKATEEAKDSMLAEMKKQGVKRSN